MPYTARSAVASAEVLWQVAEIRERGGETKGLGGKMNQRSAGEPVELGPQHARARARSTLSFALAASRVGGRARLYGDAFGRVGELARGAERQQDVLDDVATHTHTHTHT